MKKLVWPIIVVLLLLAACARPPEPPPVVEKPVIKEEVPALQAVSWQEVPGWLQDDPSLALGAFLKSCTSLRWRPQWQTACQEAAVMEHASELEVRAFFERNFVPHQVSKANGSTEGLLTGYYAC